MIVVRIPCGDIEGIGYTYGHPTVGKIVQSDLASIIKGRSVTDIPAMQGAMVARVRNNGQCGLAMMAISAVDIALWDLKAKWLESPLCVLLGQSRDSIPVYGSGGFTNYSNQQMYDQLHGWAEAGMKAMKIKVGRDIAADFDRVSAAREAIGKEAGLYVDANGAYSASDAICQAKKFSAYGVDWLEEPVPATAVRELRYIRERMPEGLRIAAGEYGYGLSDFRALLEYGAVDVLQADATRCGGITGFLKAGILAEAFRIPLSSHCAPAIHLHVALSLPSFSEAEYFHDHVLIEQRFFDGAVAPREGRLYPDPARPGLGLTLREQEADAFRVA
jgi:L-alanine-DL-glutamate epimerase-like enolase superfamily enzyme